MIYFMLQRLGRLVLTVFIVATVVFVIVRVVPGDPALVIAGVDARPQDIAAIRAKLGTDRPMLQQYGTWMWGLLHLDLGHSFTTGESVSRLILARFPLTFTLALAGFVLSMLIAVPFGVISAVRRWQAIDYTVMAYTQIGLAVPSFWLGIILLLLFSVRIHLFPLFGLGGISSLVLPSVALGIERSALLIRIVRGSMIEELSRDYVITALAKGLPRRVIIIRHALRNALLPVITIAGIQFGYLLGGAIIIEQVFSLPGLGRLFLTAISNRDFPLVQGGVIFVAAVFSVVSFLADILYSLVNPRVRVS
ncbi:MAG TPA: ABC transporter permease [Spirochaetia bacterium]|nr:ABC transporter permease [Spirochaetia bacterium]